MMLLVCCKSGLGFPVRVASIRRLDGVGISDPRRGENDGLLFSSKVSRNPLFTWFCLISSKNAGSENTFTWFHASLESVFPDW